jgi:hypothetical protein
MSFKRLKALIGSPSAIPIRAIIAFSIFGGYAMLVSYTWPLGFLPQVTLQALPVVLLSFVPIFVLTWIFLWILFYPLSAMTSTRFWAVQLHPGATFADEEDIIREGQKRVASEPLGVVYREMEETIPEWLLKLLVRNVSALSWLPSVGRAASFGLNIVILGIVCAPSFFLWYALSALFPWNRGLFLLGVPLLFATLKWIREAVRAQDAQAAAGPSIWLLVVLVALPMIRPEPGPWRLPVHLGPNVLVREALRLSGTGGGISARVGSETESAIAGYLVFYDGIKVWLRPCDKPNEIVRVMSSDVLSVFNDDICSANAETPGAQSDP